MLWPDALALVCLKYLPELLPELFPLLGLLFSEQAVHVLLLVEVLTLGGGGGCDNAMPL